MNERRAIILEAVLKEFIRSGRPVSSGQLFEEYDFDIKPAAIRLELSELADEGYLSKLYHSAGRVPTDRGYEFFVERILSHELDFIREPRLLSKLAEEFFSGDRLEFLDQIAESLHVLSIGYDLEGENVYKKGLDELLRYEDWEAIEDVVRVVRDIENIDEHLEAVLHDIYNEGSDKPRVFVGSNPILKNDSLSVILDSFDDFLILLVGPKRMNYRTNLGFLSKIKQHINTINHERRNTN
ncbi:MAG: hypothetical protein A3A04_01070 [Candidatus Harrisonbacteria bacterium RIFCSPLOWO2_01_FULL_40_28]|uniref:Heat-inducible transcription repressor HrcA C-terminal domain-containing protein n=1 Tax=Candidatus Harrisonbacteria bacterium RIFCSPLOWO2_01_FULL_40_28 TaxID=1798406 RepID=A0A1G1ZM04_9BACT|nr:MAG: hypothetical protein A3A04_01070 [Candidatus Harrisonbacteria bacterium RIFCSPLOWO2_01_FULL_40_28]